MTNTKTSDDFVFFTLDDFDKGLYGLSIGPINKIIAAPTIDNKVKQYIFGDV